MNLQIKKILKYIYFLPGSLRNRFVIVIKGGQIGRRFEVVGNVLVRNRGGNIVIGDNCRIRSGEKTNPIGCGTKTCFQVYNGAYLNIGNHVKMSNVSISCQRMISIGNDVMLGGGVRIYDTDFHSLNPYVRMELVNIPENPSSKEIVISDRVFIGAGSFILKGSVIGENSIVGAGSVVSGDIPANQIWAGNPARFIRNLTEEELLNHDE